MNAIYLKNLRCFAGPGWIPLAPVTLLIGENSSGKTTFLAAARLASDLANHNRGEFDFNEEPFRLGAFEQLAHYKGGRGGRAKAFELGLEQVETLFRGIREGSPHRQSFSVQTQGTFTSVDAQPKLVAWTQTCDKDYVRAHVPNPAAEVGTVHFEYLIGDQRRERSEPSVGFLPRPGLLPRSWFQDLPESSRSSFFALRPMFHRGTTQRRTPKSQACREHAPVGCAQAGRSSA